MDAAEAGPEDTGKTPAAPGAGALLRKLLLYFAAHKWQLALVLLACSFETGFYWAVPLAFRYLIDNTLAGADRSNLIEVLFLLGAGTAAASVVSLLRSRHWARVESQVVSDIKPAVLILDEATSALDPQTEAEVNATLRQAGEGRTVISVTHRLAAVIHCDHIFVMERGRLVEQGRHEDLVRNGGVYSALWQLSETAAPADLESLPPRDRL